MGRIGPLQSTLDGEERRLQVCWGHSQGCVQGVCRKCTGHLGLGLVPGACPWGSGKAGAH